MRRPQRPDSLLPSRGSSHGRLSTWLPLPQRTAAGRPLAVGGRGGIYETCFPSSDTPLRLENSEPGLGPSPGTDCTMPPQHTPRSPTWAPPALPGAGTQPLNALNSCADSQQINIKDGRLQRVL